MKENNMKKLGWMGSIVLMLIPHILLGVSPDSVLNLEDVINIALKENPQLRAMYSNADAAKTRIPQASSLPDPQLTLGIMSLPANSYAFNQEPMTQKTIGISQSFPFFGKLALRENIASSEHRIVDQEVQQTNLVLLKNVKDTFFRMAFLQRAEDILIQNRTLLHDLIEITRTRYSVGKGIQQDILKSQLQSLQIEQQLIEIQEQYKNVSSELNILLNRLPQESLARPQQPPLTDLDLDIIRLQEIAAKNSPILMMFQHEIELNQAQVSLARREYWPDFMLSVSYGQRETMSDFLSAMISVNIPLYAGSKQARNVEEKKYHLQATEHTYSDQKNNLYLKVKNLADETAKNRDLIILYREQILPHAEQALNSSIAAYQNDKVDFLTVIDNQVTLLNNQLQLERFIAEYHQSVANLELICGTGLVGVTR